MLRAFVHNTFALGPMDVLTAEERSHLASTLPRNSLRRCSDLGVLMAAAMDALNVTERDTVILLSKGGDSRAVEAYLESFPTPSPTRFQTSVHPGSIQQVRVAKQAPLSRYMPMIGDHGLPLLGLRTALLSMPGECVVLGGEERCEWLERYDMGTPEAFVFGLRLSAEPEGLGSICFSWEAGEGACDAQPLKELFRAVQDRQELRLAHSDIGAITLGWK